MVEKLEGGARVKMIKIHRMHIQNSQRISKRKPGMVAYGFNRSTCEAEVGKMSVSSRTATTT